jgi:mono/diheme cytochrome c family protein
MGGASNEKNTDLWVGSILGGLIALLVIVVLLMYLIGSSLVNKVYDVQLAEFPIPSGPAAIARGKHLVESMGLCVECHGDNLAGDILEHDPFFGILAPSNLTSGRGGVGGEYTDMFFVRAIRNGINKDGNPMAILPSNYYNIIGDEDIGAIAAYL